MEHSRVSRPSIPRSPQAGMTTLMVVGFTVVFMLILGTISSYALQQGRYGRALFAGEQALHIAEAGLENFRWLIAHNTAAGGTIMSTGAGLSSLPTTYVVSDPEGGTVGSATITATAALQCGRTQWVDLSSTGSASVDPTFKRTLLARYMRPSVGEYSNLLNSDVWAGSDRQITGPYFNNLGIRMDGTNNSTVSSAVSTWQCSSSFGCSPTQTKAGVFGAGSGSALWLYPVQSIDFGSISTSFTNLETYARASGIFLSGTETYVGNVKKGSTYSTVAKNEQKGYHIIFQSNGTVRIYSVTATSWNWSQHVDTGSTWLHDYYRIAAETELTGSPFTVPSGCAIIYSKARTWIEGTVLGKITVVAADADVSSPYNPDVLIPNNINYQTTDGTTGLTVIAENSIMYPENTPTVMSVRGTFVAQNGYYGRNLYDCEEAPYDKRTSLTLNGTIVSNKRVGTQWSYSSSYCPGANTSGFLNRYESYDRLQAFNPAPFTPGIGSDYLLQLWREQ